MASYGLELIQCILLYLCSADSDYICQGAPMFSQGERKHFVATIVQTSVDEKIEEKDTNSDTRKKRK
jgi:hypothetical protein